MYADIIGSNVAFDAGEEANLFSIDFESYTQPLFSDDVRVTAFQCLVRLAPTRAIRIGNPIVSTILRVLASTRAAGLRFRYVQSWADIWQEKCHLLNLFRDANKLNDNFLTEIWTLMLESPDVQFRGAMFRVYSSLYGTGNTFIEKITSVDKTQLGKKLTKEYYATREVTIPSSFCINIASLFPACLFKTASLVCLFLCRLSVLLSLLVLTQIVVLYLS